MNAHRPVPHKRRRLAVGPLVALLTAPLAAQAPPAHLVHGDSLKHPLGARQQQLRERALRRAVPERLRGRVHEVAPGQYVELEQQRLDRLLVLLVEFGDTVVGGGAPGPRHNEIPEPDPTVNNNLYWLPDFSPEYFEDLFFSPAAGAPSLAGYYRTQSAGRYGIEGEVIDWISLENNGAHYGHDTCEFSGCSELLIQDAADAWVTRELAAGRSAAELAAFVQSFDRWDRYDYDGDGLFTEPDGYVDQFGLVSAGIPEEGCTTPCPDAIWSHRGYASWWLWGTAGPSFNPAGGIEIPGTGVWLADYMMTGENSGIGIVAHEYGHLLGLPDLYDGTLIGQAPTSVWYLMAAGEWLSDGVQGAGSGLPDLTAWEKLQLGWLDFDLAYAGRRSMHRLSRVGPSTRAKQAVVTVLPDRTEVEAITTPFAGSYAWHSGIGDDLDHSLTRALPLPAATAIRLDLSLWFDIETDWDYAYVAISADGGATWVNLPSTITTVANPNGQNFGNGITGNSGGWVPASFDLTPWAGQEALLRLRYWTDAFVRGKGLFADELTVIGDGLVAFADGAESAPNGWELDGFAQSDGAWTTSSPQFYLAEWRAHRGYDAALRTGPFNFAYASVGNFDWVEPYPFREGLLVSYWDLAMQDNWVGLHPGRGLILPVDSRPEPITGAGGQPWYTDLQVHDAPFGLSSEEPFELTWSGVGPFEIPALPPVPRFDDRRAYWFAEKPDAGVKLAPTGTGIEVVSTSAQGDFVEVRVLPLP